MISPNWTVLGTESFGTGHHTITAAEIDIRPMLFIDIFDEPKTAKIVHPGKAEILSAELSAFSSKEAVALAQLLREPLSRGGSRSGHSGNYFRTVKLQGGL